MLKNTGAWVHALGRTPLRYSIVLGIVIRIVWVFFLASHVPNALGGSRWAKDMYGTRVSAEVLRSYYDSSGPVSPDFNQCYDPYAVSLALGRGFADRDGSPTAYVAPLYSAFLAFLYVTIGRSLEAIRLAQLGLEVISILVVAKLASRSLGPDTGRLAALGYAAHPLLVYQSGLVLSETLFTTTMLLGAHALYVSLRRDSLGWRELSAGLLVGIAALVRPTAALLPIAVGAGAIAWTSMPTGRALAKTLLLAIGTTAAVGPWIARNYLIFDRFIPISGLLFNTTAQSAGRNAVSMSDWVFLRAAPLLADPIATTAKGLLSAVQMWYTTNSALFDPIIAAIQFPLVALAVLGTFRARQQRMDVLVIAIVPVYHFVVVFATAASTLVRYLVPVIPFLLILAAYGVLTNSNGHTDRPDSQTRQNMS